LEEGAENPAARGGGREGTPANFQNAAGRKKNTKKTKKKKKKHRAEGSAREGGASELGCLEGKGFRKSLAKEMTMPMRQEPQILVATRMGAGGNFALYFRSQPGREEDVSSFHSERFWADRHSIAGVKALSSTEGLSPNGKGGKI